MYDLLSISLYGTGLQLIADRIGCRKINKIFLLNDFDHDSCVSIHAFARNTISIRAAGGQR